MKKVTVLTIIVCAIFIGLFTSVFNVNAQYFRKTKSSNFIETNGRGIIYLFPRGQKTLISNMKDTADLFVGKHLVQEYKNNIFYDGEFIGNAYAGDTIMVNKKGVEIKKVQFYEYGQTGTNGVKYKIPRTYLINNLSYNLDTVKIDFSKNHIMQVHNQVYLNNKIVGYAEDGDIVTFIDNRLVISKTPTK